MQSLFRHPSGIYFLRICVPTLLRNIFGKREVIASTGTTELAIAKMVAGAQVAQWRQRFFNAGRLASLTSPSMTNDQELIRIAQGHPLLHTDGHLTLRQVSNASGLSCSALLREAASSGLSLFIRAGHTRGYIQPDLCTSDCAPQRARRLASCAQPVGRHRGQTWCEEVSGARAEYALTG